MIKHFLKIIWKQRRANGWIFAELMIVACAIWYIFDNFYVDLRTYYSPMGTDISNVWQFNLDNLTEKAPGYVPEEKRTTNETDDLLKLQEQIRRHSDVEGTCITYYSAPYSWGNSWRSIRPLDGDTTRSSHESFQVRQVTLDYFSVFRIKGKDGKPLQVPEGSSKGFLLITEDMEQVFYPKQEGLGRKVSTGGDEPYAVAAVTAPIRSDEFNRSEPFFYFVFAGSDFEKMVKGMGTSSAELSVRMKRHYNESEMNALLESMGEQLTVNNLYVYSARPIAEQRAEYIKVPLDDLKKKIAMVAFVLINVLFGITGTFWLRTQSRQGEIGIRTALGASKGALKYGLYTEGLLILALSLPFALCFAGNLIWFDVLDTHRLSYSFGRFLITFGGTYLLLAGMIILGIWLPARKAAQIQPAEALHYE